MNTKNIATNSAAVELNIFAVLGEDMCRETAYGLEYIIDEIFPIVEAKGNLQPSMSWAGFDDLTI